MTDLEKIIALWSLADKNTSIPISHVKIIHDIDGLGLADPSQQILSKLKHNKIVELNCQGEYTLTPLGIKLHHRLPARAVPTRPKIKATGHEWDRFRKILSYYIDCVHLQEQVQEYLFAKDFNKKFFIPTLLPNWLKPLGEKSQQRILISREQKAAMQLMLTRKDDDEEIYIGYPISAFHLKTGGTCYTPIGLIPIDIVDHSKTELIIDIRQNEAKINQQWLDFAFRSEESKNIINTILRLHGKDDFRGMIDLLAALPFLEKSDVKFDPKNLGYILPRLDGLNVQTQCNVAVILMGHSLRYSKTLKRELKYIRDKVSDQVLNTTALAYIFRDPVLENTDPEVRFMPLPFIESNPEQLSAIGAALNSQSVKVTGPPGTGKSQVAVNIISNLIFNGKTVLFSSKNHKAVEAIYNRCQQVISEPGLSLVNFCTKDDPNPWYKQDLEVLMAGAGAADHNYSDQIVTRLEKNIRHWRHIEKLFSPRNTILPKYEAWNQEYSQNRHIMQDILGSEALQQFSKTRYRKLAFHISHLKPPVHFKLTQCWSWLFWKIWGERLNNSARQFIKKNYSFFWQSMVDLEELKENFAMFVQCYKKDYTLSKIGIQLENKARELQPIEQGEKQLAETFRANAELLHDALTICRIQKIKQLSEDQNLVNKLKSIMTFMRSSSSPAFFQHLKTQDSEMAETGFKIFSQYYPGWAVSLLSLSKASPCIAGLFDTVIIDEASQCDPASIIPALFRAKSVVFVGDSNQFPPVIDMKPLRNDFLKTKNKITDIADQRFDFISTSAYDLSSVPPILLKEHFRCAEEIADYFNDAFYGNELHVRTDSKKLKTPRGMGFHHAVEWIDIKNSPEGEINAVEQTLKKLIDNQYDGSIGIVTPFRDLADKMKEKFYYLTSRLQNKDEDDRVLISTANGFQGGERDVIIFVLSYHDELTKGKLWYAESEENRYIYNVAVSRARACLIIVGDRERCRQSKVGVLNKLAEIPRPIKKYSESELLFESPWEKALYDALLAAGIQTYTQYPLVGRRLDLAYIEGDLKIDIEIDGVQYHTSDDGNRKMDDIYRDLQVGAVGWHVKRFWVYELRDNMQECVKQIKQCIASHRIHS